MRWVFRRPLRPESRAVCDGDAVIVVQGDLNGLMGIVVKVDDDNVHIRQKDERLMDSLLVKESQLCKVFKTGDHVKVMAGTHEGATGMIVRADAGSVVILSDTTREDIKVFTSNVMESSEVTSSRTKLGEYQLHELVLLDQSTVGLIVRVDRDGCQILKGIPDRGEVVTVKQRDMRKKIFDRNVNAHDRDANVISLRDIVRVVEGPYKGRQGPAEHIIRGILFVLDHHHLENGGYLCVRARWCVALGGTRNGTVRGEEEIDEDTAFGGDEDDSAMQRVVRKKVKEIDLKSDEDRDDEDEDEEDEDLEEDDNDMEDDEEEQAEGKSTDKFDEEQEEEEDDLDHEDDDEEEDDDDDDDDDEGRHSRMIEAVTGKSAVGRPDREGRRVKERVFSEVCLESEFNLSTSSGNTNGKSGITVEDLMTPLQDTAGFATIRKRMEQLQKRGAPLEAPLPKVIQDRLNRKAGYQKTSEDITKWQSTVKMNREAPTLVFNKREAAPSHSTASLAASFKPTTDLEKEVHSLLRESKLAEVQDVEAAEALELNKLTVEEVRERQERLAKMRNLLFRHEVKAKRMKKIKSKLFHRLLQKDQKSKADIDAAIAGADPEASKAAAIKREFNRAQERMTLKHKNSSRWAKRILKRGFNASENDGTRDAIAEQLRTHALLTRKIMSADLSDSDEASSDGEEEAEDAVSGLVLEENGKSKVLAKAKVATLKALEAGDEEDIPTSGLFSLPFMARAIEKKKKAAQNEAIAILEQLDQAEQDGNILRLDDDYSRSQHGHVKEGTTSTRIAFGEAKRSNAMVGRRQPPSDIDYVSDEDSREETGRELTYKSIEARITSNVSALAKMNFLRTDNRVETGNRLGAQHQTESRHIGDISQNGRTSYSGVGRVPAKKVEISIAGSQRKPASNGLSVELTSQSEKPDTAPDGVATHEAVIESTFRDDDSDDENPQVGLLDASGSQQDLIRQAFAGDNVEAEFEKVKSQVLDEEVPLGEGPVRLPGWGQWAHVQKIRGQPAWLLKEQELVKTKRDNVLSKRKDAQMKHVIISEKLDKKAAKYAAPSVPFPFSSREVFERSIRQPIGRDFNTDKVFRDMTRPAVIKSAGVIIDPITLDESAKRKEVRAAASVSKRNRHR